MDTLVSSRQRYANLIRERAHLRSDRLVRALAEVPREEYIGPGPWKILRPHALGEYIDTPNGDPTHVYDDVLVAIDPTRLLNNGLPSGLCAWIDALDLREGERVVHAGCGTGYYTALMAEVVGEKGRVIAIEYDRDLAVRAKDNLAHIPFVEVVCADASTYDAGAADAIFVNAGVSYPVPLWLNSLAPKGRLIVPLTRRTGDFRAESWGDREWNKLENSSVGKIGFGVMIRIQRFNSGYEVRILSPVAIFHCAGAFDADADRLLGAALDGGRLVGIRSLRRDEHDAEESCRLHGRCYCFSTRALNA
jgi:protein-L-isoaspartate(D-aspartate) O-methyltransferase